MEWVAKHDVKLANSFCDEWEPTRAKTNRLDFWKMSEADLQKWKISDYIAIPIKWETRSTVARNCLAHDLTDHWLVLTYIKLPGKKEKWQHSGSSSLKVWRPKTTGDESGFGRMIVGKLEAAEDVMGEISIEDITKCIPNAARAVEFETTRGMINWKKTAEHLEAEKNLRRRMGGEGL